ncbi:TRAP-type C4-dicarboxylate transport system substrate-binding protein [Virgibacillus natechei]|uniref:TRAP-type C4-dicarboxylate transport system substrate-binding protein n=1 Tax=Virgibacillus natechei TaxID=1216297 RepID=A0ABS4IJV4_9BACI|nr:TRAP transporter substrate-binding protein [Virgibacillus natechei]MBP1971239.1 TRAP-type C4-dicarboxylate transport system substrate-binding protein [Virgibacillus natechei]UZD12130.1 TRAP transporter substrate-binding protein [Virgibacillus natechei]
MLQKRKNNLLKSIYVALLLMVVLIISACSTDNDTTSTGAEAETSENKSENSDDTADAGNSVTLKVSHFVSPQHGYHTDVLEPFAEEIAELTDERVTAEIYPGAALGDATAQYEMTTTGVADLSYAIQAYNPGKFPLTSVADLPFIAETPEKATDLIGDLYDKFPEIQEEYADNKVLWLFGIDSDQILTTEKPIDSVEDLQGLKISTPSPASNEVVEAWGATPVFMPMDEVYEAMQRGVVDGRMGPYSGVANFQLNEVTDYITEGDFYTTNFVISMNKNVWESLSQEDQGAINSVIDKYKALSADVYASDAARGKDLAEETGIEINVLSEEDKEEFEEALDPIHNNWVEEMESEGLPGLEVHEEALRISEEY